MTWFWVFLAQAAGPLTLIGAIGFGLALSYTIAYTIGKATNKSGSEAWADCASEQARGLKFILITAVLLVLGKAIPDPNFDKQIVYKDRVITKNIVQTKTIFKDRVIEKPPVFFDLVQKCVENDGRSDTTDNIDACTESVQKQMLASKGLDKPVIVYKKVPYKEIFDTCIGDWAVGSEGAAATKERNDRIQMCDRIATDKVRMGLAQVLH